MPVVVVANPKGGAGKSTLLSVISGFFAQTSGRVLWRGQDLTPVPPGERPVTILFQDQNLFPHLTVAQNLGLGLRPDLRQQRGARLHFDLAARAERRLGGSQHRIVLQGQVVDRAVGLAGHGDATAEALIQVGQGAAAIDQPVAALDHPVGVGADQFEAARGAPRRRMPDDAEAAARELFAVLRELDATGVRLIWVETPPDGPEWDGVRDRLSRAAA